jgi:subtilase family serine protease
MRSRLISRICLSALLLLTTFPTLARATVQDRITGAVSGSKKVPLPGTVTGRAKHSTDLGAAPSDQKLNSLSLRFSMTPTQQAALIQLQAAQLNPASPLYHQWLTPEQFGAQFGLSSGDIAKVSTWLTSQGFKITSVARSSTFITFNGTVAQAQSAFGTTIHSLSYNGEQHISNISDPTLPSAIGSVVNSITGLNDFKVKPRSRARNVTVDPSQPLYTQTSCPPSTVPCHYIAPADFYTIYDINPLITAGITGKGVTIAVMGQTDIIPTDVASFRSAAGLPANAPTLKLVPTSTDPGISPADIDEAHIDVEWSGAAAQGATILYVYGEDVFINSLTYAIDNNVAPIVTISYGECETGWGNASLASYNILLLQANVQGQTVMSATGDTGATDCDATGVATEGLSVDFPASSPYVTAAGGTMFSGDVNTPATYWNSTNTTTGGSVTQYIPEQPWNETTSTEGLTAGGAGGGGVSAVFSKPAWQVGSGVPADSSRDTPDLSLNAAAMHDGYLVCSEQDGEGETPCASGFLSASGNPNVFGGTSFVAPTFSGILAMVEQELGGTPGKGLGNIGPTLYGFLNGPTYTSVFHDIIMGNNSVSCTQGTLNCPNGGAIGYNASTGYDLASGIGSIDVNKLVTGWAGVVPVGAGGTIGAGITTTSLTTSAALCGVSSGSLALSVAVIGSIAGTTPTGTVQFFVDNVAVTGGSVTLVSGAATYTLVTSSLSSGGHVISAVYSGDGNFAGSKGTLLGPASNPTLYPNGSAASVDIVSSTSADFSLTPCTGSTTAVTVQPGATSTGITLTITPTSGFTGSVTLTATNNDGMTATPSFSVSPVSITSSAGVTTSFVVLASQVTTTTDAVKAKLTSPGSHHPSGKTPWYAAGSGATIACMLLLTLPRRRRWGALLAVVLSVAALTAVGCSNSSTTGGSGGGGNPPAGTVTNASPGTYTFTITAVSGSLVHSTQVTVTVP